MIKSNQADNTYRSQRLQRHLSIYFICFNISLNNKGNMVNFGNIVHYYVLRTTQALNYDIYKRNTKIPTCIVTL